MNKTLKYILGIFLGFLGLIPFSFWIFTQFILTPERLSQLIKEQAPTFTSAQVDLERVGYSIFQHFPNMGVALFNGAIIDTTQATEPDTLLRFERVVVSINPWSYLQDETLHIPRVVIQSADLYAHYSTDSILNWTNILVETPEDTVQVDTATATTTLPFKKFRLDLLSFRNIDIFAKNDLSESLVELNDVNTEVSFAIGDTLNHLDIDFSTEEITLAHEGLSFTEELNTKIQSKITHFKNSKKILIDQMTVNINNIKMGVKGVLQSDSLRQNLNVDLHYGFNISSLEELIEMIPSHILNKNIGINAQGTLRSRGTIKGVYNEQSLPTIDFQGRLIDGAFQYDQLPYGVEHLSMQVKGIVDLNQKEHSQIDIDSIQFRGANSHLEAQAHIKNMLNDPLIDASLDAQLDFTKIAQALPFSDSITMEGDFTGELQTALRLSDLESANYGKILADGSITANNLHIESIHDSLRLFMKNTHLSFDTQADSKFKAGLKVMRSEQRVDSLSAQVAGIQLEIKDLKASFSTVPTLDTTAILPIAGSGKIAYLHALDPKANMEAVIQGADIKMAMAPQAQDKRLPLLKTVSTVDALQASQEGNRVDFTHAQFNIDLRQIEFGAKMWRSNSDVGFEQMTIRTPEFALPITMPRTKISLANNTLALSNTAVKIGKSDMHITGKFTNLTDFSQNKGPLVGLFNIESKLLDCNELMDAAAINLYELAADTTTTAEVIEPTDTTSSIVILPKFIDFTMQAKIHKIKFARMKIDGLFGEVLLQNQCLQLNDVTLKTPAAELRTTLVYHAEDSLSAYAGFDFEMREVKVNKLIEFMPALDSIMPMLRSLDGTVNFHTAAESILLPDLTPDIQSINATANINGDTLVLMDGETFAEIAKTFRFKNKKRNVIDSVWVDMVLTDGKMDIHPFYLTMDRYRAAIGGKHYLDMSFDYHISLLDSPIPFNVGVDVSGNLDDFDYKITKAKFKKLKIPNRTNLMDSTSVSMKHKFDRIIKARFHAAKQRKSTIQ